MNCQNCGAEIPEGQVSCPSCGTIKSRKAPSKAPNKAPSKSEPEIVADKPAVSRKKWVFPGAILVLAAFGLWAGQAVAGFFEGHLFRPVSVATTTKNVPKSTPKTAKKKSTLKTVEANVTHDLTRGRFRTAMALMGGNKLLQSQFSAWVSELVQRNGNLQSVSFKNGTNHITIGMNFSVHPLSFTLKKTTSNHMQWPMQHVDVLPISGGKLYVDGIQQAHWRLNLFAGPHAYRIQLPSGNNIHIYSALTYIHAKVARTATTTNKAGRSTAKSTYTTSAASKSKTSGSTSSSTTSSSKAATPTTLTSSLKAQLESRVLAFMHAQEQALSANQYFPLQGVLMPGSALATTWQNMIAQNVKNKQTSTNNLLGIKFLKVHLVSATQATVSDEEQWSVQFSGQSSATTEPWHAWQYILDLKNNVWYIAKATPIKP